MQKQLEDVFVAATKQLQDSLEVWSVKWRWKVKVGCIAAYPRPSGNVPGLGQANTV